MRQLKCFTTSVVGIAAVIAPAAMLVVGDGTAGAAPATPPSPPSQGATKVPISTQNMNCDGSPATPPGSGSGWGSPSSMRSLERR